MIYNRHARDEPSTESWGHSGNYGGARPQAGAGRGASKARVFNKIGTDRGSQGLFPGVLTACTCDMHN